MKVLLVGSGAREHALGWKVAQSPRFRELHAAPGNPGIAQLGDCHPVRAEDVEGLLGLCRDHDIDLVLIGPEAPLVAGMADQLRHAGVAVFGPGRAAAAIEGSKTFAKEVMAAVGVSAAERLAVARPPCVVKADGLTAGKGVFVCRTQAQLDAALHSASAYGNALVIEELLEGVELSVFALCNGREVVALGAAQDFKRVGEGDTGPNTGGMGSYSPVPGFGAAEVEQLVEAIHRPVLDELASRGAPFVGVLFAGLMLTENGPRVLEFNARFGDPETQSLLPRLGGDLLELLWAAATSELCEEPALADTAAVTVVIAAPDYPGSNDVGTPISGLEAAAATGALVFHAGTALRGDTVVTNGGRILSVTGCGGDLGAARGAAYEAVELVSFPGLRYRRDIAREAEVQVRG